MKGGAQKEGDGRRADIQVDRREDRDAEKGGGDIEGARRKAGT